LKDTNGTTANKGLHRDSQSIPRYSDCRGQALASAVCTKLGSGAGIITIDQLSTRLYEKCGTQETYESLRDKMIKIQLEGRTLKAMADEITETADRLVAIECQRHDAAAKTAVRSIVQRDALLTFKKRVPERLKLVVEAARPDTIEDALAVASAALAGVDQEEA
jgi:hypothetical protein